MGKSLELYDIQRQSLLVELVVDLCSLCQKGKADIES